MGAGGWGKGDMGAGGCGVIIQGMNTETCRGN